MALDSDASATSEPVPTDTTRPWLRRALMPILLGAALVGVAVTLSWQNGGDLSWMRGRFGWVMPIAVVLLTGLAWILHELEIRALRDARDRLQQDLEAARGRERAVVVQLERAEADLTRLSRIDALTNLANEQAFLEALDEEWRRAARQGTSISLVMIDIDQFKAYCDANGQEKGDACLTAVGGVIKGSARRAGDIAARRQGNRFVVLFAHTDREIATELARRIKVGVAALNLPHPSSRVAPHVTISAGVASTAPTVNDSADSLVGDANDALHVAKAAGRNRVETMWRRARSA